MKMNGIDISSYQKELDLSKVPCEFVIIKATEGTSYINPYCHGHFSQGESLGKKLGAYHFASGEDVNTEAEFFVSHVKGYIGKAIFALDWEADAVNRGVSWAKQWLDRVYELTGVKPLIYMPNSVVNGYDWSSVANGDYGLWNAGYYAGYQTMGYNPDAPIIGGTGAWSGAAIYQYTSSGQLSGWSGNLDLNVFYGDAAAWDKYAGTEMKQRSEECVLKDSFGDDVRIYTEDTNDGYIYMQNKQTGLYLDVTNGDGSNGTLLQWYEKNETDAQKFKIVRKSHGEADYILFEPKTAPGKYLSVENNGKDGSGKNHLKVWEDLHNNQQKFWMKQAEDGTYLIYHVYSLFCIGVK